MTEPGFCTCVPRKAEVSRSSGMETTVWLPAPPHRSQGHHPSRFLLLPLPIVRGTTSSFASTSRCLLFCSFPSWNLTGEILHTKSHRTAVPNCAQKPPFNQFCPCPGQTQRSERSTNLAQDTSTVVFSGRAFRCRFPQGSARRKHLHTSATFQRCLPLQLKVNELEQKLKESQIHVHQLEAQHARRSKSKQQSGKSWWKRTCFSSYVPEYDTWCFDSMRTNTKLTVLILDKQHVGIRCSWLDVIGWRARDVAAAASDSWSSETEGSTVSRQMQTERRTGRTRPRKCCAISIQTVVPGVLCNKAVLNRTTLFCRVSLKKWKTWSLRCNSLLSWIKSMRGHWIHCVQDLVFLSRIQKARFWIQNKGADVCCVGYVAWISFRSANPSDAVQWTREPV